MALKPFQRNEQAINQERDRDKKQQAEQSEGGVSTYFLKKGTATVRILPPYNERGVWFRETQEHTIQIAPKKWQSFTCPRPSGKQCPFCDQGTALYEEGSEEAVAKAKDFRPRTQFLFNALILSDNRGNNASKGVQVLKAGVMVKRQLLELDTNVQAGWGDMTNLETGFNVNIERTGEGLETKYSVLPFGGGRSNILENLATQGIDANSLTLHDLDALFPPRSYEELSGVMEGQATAPGFPAQTVKVSEEQPVPVTSAAAAPQSVPATTTTGPAPVTVQTGGPQPVVPTPVAVPVIPAPPTEES